MKFCFSNALCLCVCFGWMRYVFSKASHSGSLFFFSFGPPKIEIGCLTRASKRDVRQYPFSSWLTVCTHISMSCVPLLFVALDDCICKFLIHFSMFRMQFARDKSDRCAMHRQNVNIRTCQHHSSFSDTAKNVQAKNVQANTNKISYSIKRDRKSERAKTEKSRKRTGT